MKLALNQAELAALNQSLSNDARVLYLLGLRPYCDVHKATTPALNYKQLLLMLNSKEEKFTLGRQVNSLIKELVEAGLVSFSEALDSNRSFNGKVLILPLLLMKQNDYAKLHLQWHNMTMDWQPDEKLMAELAKLVGIIDTDYTVEELGDFIAYWLGRPEANFSQFQWTQKFVFNLKQKRLARGFKSVKKVGNQLVKTKAGVVADDNAKSLVEKYHANYADKK